MNGIIDLAAYQLIAKITLVLATAWLGAWLLATRNPRWQVWLWRVTGVGLLTLLVSAALPPLYDVPVLAPHDGVATVWPAGSASPDAPRRAEVAIQVADLAARDAQATSTQSFHSDVLMSHQTSVADGARAIPAGRTMEREHHEPAAAASSLPASTAAGKPQDSALWRKLFWAIYGLVGGVMVLRLVMGARVAARVTAAGSPAPPWVQVLADSIAEEMSWHSIPIRVTRWFESPVLAGVWRPTILLPESLLGSATFERDVRGAVVHELAHAAGRDLLWDRSLALLTAFLWPHPLVWLVRSAHRLACERVSDRVAVDCLGDLAAYQSLVARIALRVSGATANVGLAMAHRSNVRRRLTALVHCPHVPRLGRRAAAMAVVAMVGVVVLGTGVLVMRPVTAEAAAMAPRPDSNQPDDRRQRPDQPASDNGPARLRPAALKFNVVRKDDGQKVAGAKVTVRMYDAAPNVTRELLTDEQGVATFEYPDGDKPVHLWAMVHKTGLVPYYVNFGRDLVPAVLPQEKLIQMDPGKKVGGTVVDSEGKPVAGAELSITVPATDTPTEIHYHLLHETTQADGTWLLDGAPLDSSSLYLTIEHPRFLREGVPVQDRVDGTYPLDRGLTLAGRVTDSDGVPAADATITIGRDRWGSGRQPTRVEEDGTFTVSALRPEQTWVTAESPRHAPQVQAVTISAQTKPLDFALAPGNTTRLKVVNESGEPVAGARIVADTWNGYRTLWWQAGTDAEGMALWDGAPREPVEFHVLADGYAARRDVIVAPQDQPHVVRLQRPLTITGTVTDQQQRPIGEFRVELGRKFPGRDDISWMSYEGTAGRNGQFVLQYSEACDAIYLRIEASGFTPWKSEPLDFGVSEHKIAVQLEPGAGPSGIVFAPDGQPAAGARLTLLTAQQGMQFTRGYRPSGGKQTIVSDQQGRYLFLLVEERWLVAAVHESGYAEVTEEDIAAAGGIQLQPWAKVEVTVRRGAATLADASVAIQPFSQRRQPVEVFSYGIDGMTDAAGRVVFEQVVPGSCFVTQTIRQPSGSGMMVYPQRSSTIQLKPGETAEVQLGGEGVTVTGRLSVTGTPPREHRWGRNEAARLSTAGPNVASESRKHYSCLIADDGSFSITDIVPGSYTLGVNLTAVPDPNSCGMGEAMGRITREFEITGDEPVVDLGVLEGTWFSRLGAGDAAPMFAAQLTDGASLTLADLAGRLVLVDFWATWCGPCMAEMPLLGQLHQEFAADRRFQLLGLSLDHSAEDTATAVTKHGWPWSTAFAGPGTGAMIPTRFDVKSIPEKFLIDVDGTILYRGRDLEEITQLIRKRLSELPAAEEISTHASGAQSVNSSDDFAGGANISVAVAVDNMEYAPGRTPTPKGPGLILWSEDGQEVRRRDDVGASGWLTGPNLLAFDPQRERLYCCDKARRRLLAIDRRGRELFATPVPDLHAVAVDEKTGDVWCLTLASLNSGELVILDAEGNERLRRPCNAFTVAYSPAEDLFWMAGKSIDRVSRDGKVLSSVAMPEGAYTFTDVAVDRQRGGAWVLEDDHPDMPLSQLRVWRATTDGTATPVHTFREGCVPRTLVCVEGQPWVAAITNYTRDAREPFQWAVQRLNADGTAAPSLDIAAMEIAVGLQSGTIWVRTAQGLQQIRSDGKILLTVSLPEDLRCVQIAAF